MAQRFSLLMTVLISGCAQSAPPQDVIIKNHVEGCFTLNINQLERNKDPVLLSTSISPARDGQDCPCKSALMQYSTHQEIAGNIFPLISGNFSILNNEKLMLPVTVQGNLIFADHAVTLSISCSNP